MRNEELQKEVMALQQRVQSLKLNSVDLIRTQQILDARNRDVDDLRNKLANLEAKLAQSMGISETIMIKEKEISLLQSSNERLAGQLQDKQNELNKALGDVERLELQLKGMQQWEREYNKLKEVNARLMKEKEQASGEVPKLN